MFNARVCVETYTEVDEYRNDSM